MGSYTLFWECKVSKLIGTESITVALSSICARKKTNAQHLTGFHYLLKINNKAILLR
jgi:hypothetical protein